MYRRLALILCTAVLAGLASLASATTTVHLTDRALVEGAELILLGDAMEVTTTWVDRDLVTLVTVEVEEVIKGEVGESVEVALPGGVDLTGPVPLAVTWPGAPTLVPGERAVLFLESYGPVAGAFAITGWSQGKFIVQQGTDGGTEVYRSAAIGDEPGEGLVEFMAKVRSLLTVGEEAP